MVYIDNVEEIFCIFSDAPKSLKSNLYKVTDLHFTVYAVADSEEKALDHLADNGKLDSIKIGSVWTLDDDDLECLTPLGSYWKYFDTRHTRIDKIETDKLGTFADFIGKALEDKLK
jgi:hypothetical protein